MNLQAWYNISQIAIYICIGAFLVMALGYCLSIATKRASDVFSKANIIAGLVLCSVLIANFVIEGQLYPAGECPNCEQSVTAKYCEDCGWRNDSYFEQTDRRD